MDERHWEITFSDMLTLLLTFFVFIISISTFKTKEYKEFWDNVSDSGRQSTTSFKFELIKGIHMPKLNAEAETLLTELENTFTESDFKGMNVYCNENKITLMVSEQLSFTGGKSELRDELKPLLEGLIPSMEKSKFEIHVEGHTDSLSSPKIDNMELSLSRALTVARFLNEKGLSKEKISVAGYGPYRPVADNGTHEGRTANRRVEINVIINND